LPLTPTEKGARAHYRALLRGATIHDMSYLNCFELRGPFLCLLGVLNSVLAVKLPAEANGAQEYAGMLQDANGLQVCPVSILFATPLDDAPAGGSAASDSASPLPEHK
jgi:hypothetical protein